MKVIFRDENGSEEVLEGDDHSVWGIFCGAYAIIWHIVIFAWSGFTLKYQLLWLLFTSPLILAGIFMIISDKETIVIDRNLNKIIIDNHLFSKFHKIEKISFSNIKEVKITYNYCEYLWFCNTDLITIHGKSIRLKSSRFEVTSDHEKEDAKKFGIKICKMTGINGHHIDTSGKSSSFNCNSK